MKQGQLMSMHDDQLSMSQMLAHTREAVDLVQGRNRQDLDTDRVFGLAIEHLLEIVGEAANRVTDETQALYPQIPWGQVIGLRNRLIHGYDSIDNDIVWQIVNVDLPTLVITLETIIGSER
jgi:uncharacterized protein with HEPN domain